MKTVITVLLFSIAIAGCARLPQPALPAPKPVDAVQPGTLRVSVDLDGCACNLYSIDTALMTLPGVARLRWQADVSYITLFLIDGAEPPSDAQVAEALDTVAVGMLKSITRP